MTKKNLMIVSICALLFVALMLVATFFDLQINIAIGNAESVFGQFFANVGEFPAWLMIPIAGVILFQAVNKENKFYVLLKVAFLMMACVGFFLLFKWIDKRLFRDLKWNYLYIGFFAVIGTWLSIIATNKVDKEIMQKLVIFAIFITVCVAVSQGVVTVLKYAWSRQRFRNLEVGNIIDGSTKGFTPWYKPNGLHPDKGYYFEDNAGTSFKDAYKSFPSGHTAAAALSFVVVMLPDLFEKLKKYKLWFYVLPAVYTFLVAISRIVNRAHYLSDVTVAATITIVTVFVAKYLTFLVEGKIKQKMTRMTTSAEETAIEK